MFFPVINLFSKLDVNNVAFWLSAIAMVNLLDMLPVALTKEVKATSLTKQFKAI